MIQKIKTIRQLAEYMSVDLHSLESLDPEKSYLTFRIPKPGSTEMRTIETPTGPLRYILDRLADALQWHYLDNITDAAYGYIRSVKPEKVKRNIFSNAKRHLGRKYLLNIDLDNFFYQIDREKVFSLFRDYRLFSFEEGTADLLTNLVTYHCRMPMGSPVSPPISNFATIEMDKELLSWAARSSFRYTRYVDDLSFSSNMEISPAHYRQISEIVHSHRFVIDEHKTKWFGKDEPKEITGLITDQRITVPEEYFRDFEKEIAKFSHVIDYASFYPDANVFAWTEKLKQILNGRLAFLQMVYGKNHPVITNLRLKINEACKPDETTYSISWRYAGYDYH